MKLGVRPIRIKRPQRSPLHAVAHLSASGVRVLVYDPPHRSTQNSGNTPPENTPIAEGHAPLTMTEGSPPDFDQLTAALRSATAALPAPIDALTLIIPATQCRMAHRAFPARVAEAEAHALAAQMATQMAAEMIHERGHATPVAFDWQRRTNDEVALCLAPRALIEGYLKAVQAAGLRCIAISPETDSAPASHASAPFNLIPWRNTAWLKRGRTRILWLAATTLLLLTATALIVHGQTRREQALSAQNARLHEALKSRQAQLSDLAKLRQQREVQQAAQHAEQAAREAVLRQQQTWAAQLDQLARRRPREIRYLSLNYDGQKMRLEGLAQSPEALTRLLKALPCPHLGEGRREGRREAQGPLRFVLQLPGDCRATP